MGKEVINIDIDALMDEEAKEFGKKEEKAAPKKELPISKPGIDSVPASIDDSVFDDLINEASGEEKGKEVLQCALSWCDEVLQKKGQMYCSLPHEVDHKVFDLGIKIVEEGSLTHVEVWAEIKASTGATLQDYVDWRRAYNAEVSSPNIDTFQDFLKEKTPTLSVEADEVLEPVVS